MELAHLRRVAFWTVVGAVAGLALDLPPVAIIVVALIAAFIPEITG